jgi:hypothetical protein
MSETEWALGTSERTRVTPFDSGINEVDILIRSLYNEAADIVLHDPQDGRSDEQIIAQIAASMIELAESQKWNIRSAQALIVAYLAETQLWQAHPLGFADLRDYLKNTGMGPSSVSEMGDIGEVILPYCNAHDIDLRSALIPGVWPRTRETIPALKRAIQANDAPGVEEILRNARTIFSRDALRDMYRVRRTEKIARAAQYTADERVYIVIAVQPYDANIIRDKLISVTDFDLEGRADYERGAVNIRISSPRRSQRVSGARTPDGSTEIDNSE